MDAMRLTKESLSNAFRLKVFMKTLLLICTLISFNLYAGDDCVGCGLSSTNIERAVSSGRKIKNDVRVCGAIENDDFKKLKKNLKKYYQTTLRESYFDIECMGGDLLDLVIKSPTNRYFSALHLQRYFEKKEKTPKMFSEILLHEIDGRNAIKRIEAELYYVRRSDNLRGGELDKKLTKLKQKYLAYLKKHPVAGSAESLSSQ